MPCAVKRRLWVLVVGAAVVARVRGSRVHNAVVVRFAGAAGAPVALLVALVMWPPRDFGTRLQREHILLDTRPKRSWNHGSCNINK